MVPVEEIGELKGKKLLFTDRVGFLEEI